MSISLNPFAGMWRSEPVELKVEVPLQQALARLRAEVPNIGIYFTGDPTHRGAVRIHLAEYLMTTHLRNAVVLSARFIEMYNGTYLVGEFRDSWLTRSYDIAQVATALPIVFKLFYWTLQVAAQSPTWLIIFPVIAFCLFWFIPLRRSQLVQEDWNATCVALRAFIDDKLSKPD